jgi:hypothetical protein
MKTKFFTLFFLVTLLQSCVQELPGTAAEQLVYIKGDIRTLVVPNDHDLRPITLQNTNINLSDKSRADIVKIKIFKIEDDLQILLYEGFINREQSINQ